MMLNSGECGVVEQSTPHNDVCKNNNFHVHICSFHYINGGDSDGIIR